jgi:hypothetical protein
MHCQLKSGSGPCQAEQLLDVPGQSAAADTQVFRDALVRHPRTQEFEGAALYGTQGRGPCATHVHGEGGPPRMLEEARESSQESSVMNDEH